MRVFRVTIGNLNGIPMMTHNKRLANPHCKYTQALDKINTDGRRRGADKLKVSIQRARIEWEGGFYHDETDPSGFDLGPYIPGEVFRACLVAGGKCTRNGKNVQRAVIIYDAKSKLEFDGPRRVEEMYEDGRFMDQRMCRVGTAMVLRSRPFYDDYTFKVNIGFDDTPSGIPEDTLRLVLRDAGLYAGIGDARNLGFGRWEARKVEEIGLEDAIKKAA
jgi:hypothetical protein